MDSPINPEVKSVPDSIRRIDWKTRDHRSELYKAYYLKMIRESFYEDMNACKESDPRDEEIRYWYSLRNAQQEVMLNQVLEMHLSDPHTDLDDVEDVSAAISLKVSAAIDWIIIPKRWAANALQKNPRSRHYTAPSVTLLRSAIQNHRVSR